MPELTLPIEDYTLVHRYSSLSNPFPSGAVLTRSVYPAATPFVRAWALRWQHLTAQELALLVQLFDDTGGGAAPFDFVPPNELAPISVRFVEPVLRPQFRKRGLASVALEVEALRPQD